MEEISTDDDNVDRISQLPEFIIHHIMSFFDSPVDLLRISVLSKNWFALTASFPILDFDISRFTMSRESFFKYVDYTTSNFCKQNVTSTHTFNLVTSIDEPSEVDIIDKCLELILNKGVQVLFINLVGEREPILPVYRLPNLLLSASSLTSLKIYCCELPSSLMIDDVKFNSLKLLHLYDVHIDEEVIKHLTTYFPLLKEFNLFRCHGFKLIWVYRHQNLRKVQLYLEHRVERIDIEAPNLRNLFIFNSLNRDAPLLKLASCKKLTRVAYCGFPSPKATLFANFLSNFPFIKILFLKLPNDFKNLKLSSSSLRAFELLSECDLEEIDINTPNLLLFQFTSSLDIPIPLEKNSALLKARMQCYPKNDVDALWFRKLRRFLGKKNPFKVLEMHISTKFIDVEELNLIHSPPYELEHVDLQLDTIKELSVYVSVVDAVLWCCRPQSLTLRSNFSIIDSEEQDHVIKFTYEKLLQQEDQRQTNIQIVSSSSSKAKNHFSNSNSLLAALPRDRLTQSITFMKEKVLQEEADSGTVKGIRYVNMET